MTGRLLCHCDGTNGSTSFVDTTGNVTLTATNATVSTTTPKFGTGCANFSSAAGRIVTSSFSLFNLGSGQFTIEAWAYFTSAPGAGTWAVAAQFGGSINLGWFFGMSGGSLSFFYSTTGTDNPSVSAPYTPALNTWIHLAVDRDSSNVIRVYANGVVIASATVASTIFASTQPCVIGNDNNLSRGFPGNLDEVLIDVGTARHAGAFTPPTAPFYAPLDGLSGVTGAWSAARQLLTAYGGAFYHLTSGAVDTWYDQSGSARNFTQATVSSRPSVSTAGPAIKNMLDFDGVDDSMDSVAISNFLTAASGYVVAVFHADDVSSSNQSNIYNNDPIWADNSGYTGTFIKAGNLQSFNWDTNADTPTAVAISTGTVYVVEWWHDSGNVNQRVNRGTTNTIASGNTGALTGLLRLGRDYTNVSSYDGRIAELATFNLLPASGVRDTLVQDMLDYYTATGTVTYSTAQVTQMAAEHWADRTVHGTTNATATQIALEQWAAVTTTPSQALVTQVALEQWAAVAARPTSAWVTQIVLEQWASTVLPPPVVPPAQARAMVLA